MAKDTRLLEPRWAGPAVDDAQAEYIREELALDRKLLLDWGFRGGQALNLTKVKRVAACRIMVERYCGDGAGSSSLAMR